MRVAHFTAFMHGGASALRRIHAGLIEADIDSHIFAACDGESSPSDAVTYLPVSRPSKWDRRKARWASRLTPKSGNGWTERIQKASCVNAEYESFFLAEGFGDGVGDQRGNVTVEWAGKNGIGGGLLHGVGKGVGCGEFHGVGNLGRSDIESSAENTGEGEDVVDLIGEVTATSAHDGGTCCFGEVGHDLGFRVCHGEDDGVGRHCFDVGFLENVAFAHSDEDVGADDDFAELALGAIFVRQFSDHLFGLVEIVAVFVDRSFGVADDDIANRGTMTFVWAHAAEGVWQWRCRLLRRH